MTWQAADGSTRRATVGGPYGERDAALRELRRVEALPEAAVESLLRHLEPEEIAELARLGSAATSRPDAVAPAPGR